MLHHTTTSTLNRPTNLQGPVQRVGRLQLRHLQQRLLIYHNITCRQMDEAVQRLRWHLKKW